MASSKLTELAWDLSQAAEDAKTKCVAIKGKEVLLLVGCTGSGKTTTGVYTLGGSFERGSGGLQERVPVDGFNIGSQRASVTRGLVCQEVPDAGAMILVDAPGTGDTSGVKADLCGAIYRIMVLRAARTLRVALVLSLERANVLNERGTPVIKDLEHAAGLFHDVSKHLAGIGMVVTSDPMALMQPNPAEYITTTMSTSLTDLEKAAVPESEAGISGSQHGTQITDAGLALLRHFEKHGAQATQYLRKAEDDEDLQDSVILEELLKQGCAMYPMNILADEQQVCIRKFFKNLGEIADPDKMLESSLPKSLEVQLQAYLDPEISLIWRTLDNKNKEWASDTNLVRGLISLLKLCDELSGLGISTWAVQQKKDVCKKLQLFNTSAVDSVNQAAASGNLSNLEISLKSLSCMDDFLQLYPASGKLEALRWASREDGEASGAQAVQQVLKERLGDRLDQVKWTAPLSTSVHTLLTALEQLGQKGRDMLGSWASEFERCALSFSEQATQCQQVGETLRALNCLAEQQQFLQGGVCAVLCKYGGQHLSGGGLADIHRNALAGVKEQLVTLSEVVKSDFRQNRSSVNLGRLELFCKSTELKSMFEEDLEQELILKAMSDALLPSQEDLNSAVHEMSFSPFEDWCMRVMDLVIAVTASGEHGLKMITAKQLNFDELQEALGQEILKAKGKAKDTIEKVRHSAPVERQRMGQDFLARRRSTNPHQIHRQHPSAGALTDIGGASSEDLDQPSQDGDDLAEDVEAAGEALDRIVQLLPSDALAQVVGKQQNSGGSASLALRSLGCLLQKHTRDLLKRSKREEAWDSQGSGAASSTTLLSLNLLEPLAQAALQGLQSLPEGVSGKLPTSLESARSEAQERINSVVSKELEEMSNASIGGRGWHRNLMCHFSTAKKLQQLMPQKARLARDELKEKVRQWTEAAYKEACQAIEEDKLDTEPDYAWQVFIDKAIRSGLDFEDSPLSCELNMRAQFRKLLNDQTEKLRRVTREATRRPARLAVWRRLDSLIKALEDLSHETDETRALIKELTGLHKPLDAEMQDVEVQLQKALREERFADAGRELSSVENKGKHRDALVELLEKAIQDTEDKLRAEADEEEVVNTAKKAHSLLADVEKIADMDVRTRMQESQDKLRNALHSRTVEADDDLQMALEGRRPPKRALKIAGALSKQTRDKKAAEALSRFAQAKTSEFANMSCHDLGLWIQRHDSAWRNFPEELRSNSEAYEGLMNAFQTAFKQRFNQEKKTLDQSLAGKRWGEAKLAHQNLREVICSVIDLAVLKASGAQFGALKRKLGGAGAGGMSAAKADIRRGHFTTAIYALVNGDGQDGELELVDVITSELTKNLNVFADGQAAGPAKLKVLGAFLEVVGEDPPDELSTIWQQIRESYVADSRRVREAAESTIVLGIRAATDGDLNPAHLARALLDYDAFKGAVSDSKKDELQLAVGKYWQRVQQVVEKIASDIIEYQDTSLSLSLEPLRHWLDKSADLSEQEMKLLLASSQCGQTSVKAWILALLEEPLQSLLDPQLLQQQLNSSEFAGIRKRYKVAGRVAHIVGTKTFDLAPAKVFASQAKAAAMQAVGSEHTLSAFNAAYKILMRMNEELPEVEIANHLDEVKKAFMKANLLPHQQTVTECSTVADATQAIIKMRRIATRAPDTFDEVASQMEVSLASLRENSAFKSQGGIATVGKQLCRDDIGRLVVAEFSHVFGAAKDMENNRIFQRAGETNTSHEVVSRLTRESGLAGPEFHELTNTLGTHEEMLDNLLSDYFFSGKPMEIVQTQCRQNVDQAAAKCRSGDAGAQVALLTNLAACYTFVRCGKDLFNASWEEQKERIVKPHKAQILSIFRLLSLHKRGKSSMITWMANKWREITVSQTPNQSQDNHLVEILTGEGKCLTLGLLAAFLAKSGTPCDVVCYRKALKEQDLNAMSPFYQFLGVASSIRYATFDELCQDRLEAIKHASKKLMLGEQISGTALLQDNSARALLIDEVDVFFGRRFYGKTWDAGFRFDTAEAKDLVRVIFDAMCKKRPIRDVTSEASFQALLSKTPVEMHQALEVCASSLVQNFEDWSTPEPILNASTGRIGYKENDEVNPDLSYSNKTVFAYLSFEMEGKLTPEQADSQIGMDIFCGRFSFAELPKQYSCILGVTGTLKPLLSFGEIKTILREEYGFKHTTYAPSIFGERNLTFKEAEHVKVLDNEADWLSRLEGLVEDERKKKNAVLVFFKNEAALKKYRDWSSCVVLTERVEPHRRNGYIAAASQPGQVTLLTRAFGRGIDFQMPNESELVVFQTFLSSLVSEETQIKGRTARQGKPGQYRLILCKDHLESKFGFTEEDIQVLKSGSGEQIKAKLAGKQQIKTIAKTAGMRQRKDRAALLEKETRAWEEMLFDPASSATQKLTKLAAWNYDEMKHLHYIVLLDNSGSMGGSRWQQLTSAVQSFKQELMRDAVTASATKVTFILFNHAASIIEPAQAKPSELQDIAHMMSGGGTDFSAAFSACHEAISHSGSACPVLILFLTDGGAPSPRAAVESLLADHSKNIKGLTCVAFAGAGQGRLNEIGKQFVDQSIDFKLKGADDEASLVETFVAEAAASRAIHT